MTRRSAPHQGADDVGGVDGNEDRALETAEPPAHEQGEKEKDGENERGGVKGGDSLGYGERLH